MDIKMKGAFNWKFRSQNSTLKILKKIFTRSMKNKRYNSPFDQILRSYFYPQFSKPDCNHPLKPKSKPKRKSSKLVRTHLRSGKKGEGWVCKRRGGGADTRPLDDTIVHKISRKCMLFRLASWRAVTYMVGIYYESSPVKAAAVWRLFRTRSFPTCL